MFRAPPPLCASARRSKRVRTSSPTRMKVAAASDAACEHGNGSHQHSDLAGIVLRERCQLGWQTWRSARHGHATVRAHGSSGVARLGNLPRSHTLKMKPSSPWPESLCARSRHAAMPKMIIHAATSIRQYRCDLFTKPYEGLPSA